MPVRRLLLLSVSAGAGHLRAAQALEETVRQQHPEIEPIHVDVMDLVPKLFRKLYTESYLEIVERHPALWGYLYEKTDRLEREDSKLRRVRQAIERLSTRKLSRLLARDRPDRIVCTHFLPAGLLSRLVAEGKLEAPVWVQVTDFDVHHLWIQPRITGYCVASDEVGWRLRDRGVKPERIRVTGIPIAPVFGRRLSRTECAAELGSDPSRTTLLLMAGGFGVGAIDELAERLLGARGELGVVALAGRNEALLERLRRLGARYPGRLVPLGFTRSIERAMAASDLAVSKPGGLTTSECLALGLPMVIVSPIPGQEERNADYLLEHGAALKAHDAAGLEYRVAALLEHPERLEQMRAAARRIARPQAATDVLAAVAGYCT